MTADRGMAHAQLFGSAGKALVTPRRLKSAQGIQRGQDTGHERMTFLLGDFGCVTFSHKRCHGSAFVAMGRIADTWVIPQPGKGFHMLIPTQTALLRALSSCAENLRNWRRKHSAKGTARMPRTARMARDIGLSTAAFEAMTHRWPAQEHRHPHL
jgi:hypothetical protein